METKERPQSRHLGRKISRVRELLGIKQETLAERLGISQQAVSKMEQSEVVEDSTMRRVAQALGVSDEAIRSFSDEAVISIIANTITNNDQGSVVNYYPSFNPVDKWLDAIAENKRLYEALLKAEREKVEIMQSLLAKSKS